MTERLYFADAYQRAFSARIVARAERGGRQAVALDRSAFYPEGGGQPPDAGTLNGVAVLDVQAEDGVVWHSLERPLDGDEVEGEIDWARRFDHMQQHHGQHLLSAAFETVAGLRTVSFHLGAEAATIDLDGHLGPEAARQAEDWVNHVIWADYPVAARFVSAEELAALPLRKPPAVDGPVRVVSVERIDYSACGGTHPRSTGGVGLLHVRRWERRGDTTRVEFVCGGRALRDLRLKHAILSGVAGSMSIGLDQVEAAVERLRAAEESSRKQLAQAQEQLLESEGRTLVEHAARIRGMPVVRRVFRDRPADHVRLLARAIAAAGGVALLGLRADKPQLIFARAEALAAVDCGAL
ncbi:MAG TPA: alanyl-tRNA editing protein, partial [Herpetosiphonaceae bacterium]